MFSIFKNSFIQTTKATVGFRSMHGLVYETITEKHHDQVMEHLRNTTYRDAPLYKASGLISNGKAPQELDNVYLDSMREGISKIAFVNGKLAGIMINGVLTPDAVPGAIINMKKSTNEKYKKMDFMFLTLLLEMDMFNRFGIDRAMECRLLSTPHEFRGTGLAKVLVEKLTETTREYNFPMVVGQAVNEYLWKLLYAEGWFMIREMPYDEYIDEATGKPIYNVSPPHHILGVNGLIVDNKCKSKDPLPLARKKIIYPIKMD